jgi:hypothetical protein
VPNLNYWYENESEIDLKEPGDAYET